MNTRVEKDDFLHALTQTLNFYGKELDKMQATFWWTACNSKPVNKLKTALMEHVRVGKYAPKPADILSLVDAVGPQNRDAALPPPTSACPPEVAKAWSWFIGKHSQGGTMGSLFDKSGVSVDEQEKYLHIVNHEAHKYGTPEAIPDEFKLKNERP